MLRAEELDALITELQAGSEQALIKLYELYKDVVFSLAYSYVQNQQDAEEVTQDTFVEVFNSAKTFKGDATIKTWICRICINKALDVIRYRKRKKRFALIFSLYRTTDNSLQYDAPEHHHPGIALEHKEQWQALTRAVEALPEKQRVAFTLLKLETMSQKEAAQIMDIGENALESLYQRARLNLQKLLADFYKQQRKPKQ